MQPWWKYFNKQLWTTLKWKKKRQNLSKEIENVKKKQKEILELKKYTN